MPGSETCPGGDTATFGGTDYQIYYFESQNHHGCMFYGTQAANDLLIKISKDYTQRQIDCKSNRKSPSCVVNVEGTSYTVRINTVMPIKITAMALPWGGLLDIGPDGARGCGFDYNGDGKSEDCQLWYRPHATHSDGKNVDLGFNILGTAMDIDHKRLLKDVILDNAPHASLPVNKEGGVLKQTKDHFHVRFT